MPDQILVVDDDPQILSFVGRYLEKKGFVVLTASSGMEMQQILDRQPVDLCILDIGLPGQDGLELTKEIRQGSDMPIIVLSGRDEPYDRIIGLEFGADDYMTKPFEPRELLARIKSVLRRCHSNSEEKMLPAFQCGGQQILSFGKWNMDLNTWQVTHRQDGHDAGLTSTEFEILKTLTAHPHTVFSRNQLLDNARGQSCYVSDRTIDMHIMRLRKKIEEDPSDPAFIKTVHGIGYCFTGQLYKGAVSAQYSNDGPLAETA